MRLARKNFILAFIALALTANISVANANDEDFLMSLPVEIDERNTIEVSGTPDIPESREVEVPDLEGAAVIDVPADTTVVNFPEDELIGMELEAVEPITPDFDDSGIVKTGFSKITMERRNEFWRGGDAAKQALTHNALFRAKQKLDALLQKFPNSPQVITNLRQFLVIHEKYREIEENWDDANSPTSKILEVQRLATNFEARVDSTTKTLVASAVLSQNGARLASAAERAGRQEDIRRRFMRAHGAYESVNGEMSILEQRLEAVAGELRVIDREERTLESVKALLGGSIEDVDQRIQQIATSRSEAEGELAKAEEGMFAYNKTCMDFAPERTKAKTETCAEGLAQLNAQKLAVEQIITGMEADVDSLFSKYTYTCSAEEKANDIAGVCQPLPGELERRKTVLESLGLADQQEKLARISSSIAEFEKAEAARKQGVAQLMARKEAYEAHWNAMIQKFQKDAFHAAEERAGIVSDLGRVDDALGYIDGDLRVTTGASADSLRDRKEELALRRDTAALELAGVISEVNQLLQTDPKSVPADVAGLVRSLKRSGFEAPVVGGSVAATEGTAQKAAPGN